MKTFITGQRWISEMELKLGLGIVKEVNKRTVTIYYPASDCTRVYSVSSAPLKRVEFTEGDTISSRDGLNFTITSVSTNNEIFTYHGENIDLPESELKDSVSFTTAKNRLLNGSVDHNNDFNLRYRSLQFQYRIRQSPVRGFIGPRIDLIPHQLYMANEITSRYIPRVLLSDETGLGKTIEACLVLHRLIKSERIERVLILVPHSLVHQWFVELLRRFNLVVRIFDQEYKDSLKSSDTHENPFLEDQLCISSIDFLTYNEEWKKLAISAGWDMVIIDEAHHLLEESAEYKLAKDISTASRGLMLLTATPEQFGRRSHFARMHLLDPARYYDFNIFEKEAEQYLKISGIINKLVTEEKLSKSEKEELYTMFSNVEAYSLDSKESFINDLENKEDKRLQLIEDLLDRYGTGRDVFRNTRATIKGFPKRIAFLIPLESSKEDLKNIIIEFQADNISNDIVDYNFKNDPRIIWLIAFLKDHKNEKVLLICHSKEKVIAIEKSLKEQIYIDIALFHEDLTLLQRDRNASYFSDEDGAQILICSEIGSEGRNFQISHNLVLFDLPLNPELLEQRIGRLDRIGQKHTINIHVPYLIQSEYEIVARWYHDGLNAFQNNVPGAYQVYQKMGNQIRELASGRQFSQLENCIEITKTECAEINIKLKKGRDRLLELNSFRPHIAKHWVNEITSIDSDTELEEFMMDVFELYGIVDEYISEKTYKLDLALLSDLEFPLPILRRGDINVTFERTTALSHEHLEFLSWDHPMVYGVLELILSSEKGNCTFALWPDTENQEILLEAIFVLECVASKNLYVDRFLPPSPVRVMVNHSLRDCEKEYPVELCRKHLENCREFGVLDNPQVKQDLIPNMLNACHQLAQDKASEVKDKGLSNIESTLTVELKRLKELQKVNKEIRDEEISSYQQEIELLRGTIQDAEIRLDSLRFIYRGVVE